MEPNADETIRQQQKLIIEQKRQLSRFRKRMAFELRGCVDSLANTVERVLSKSNIRFAVKRIPKRRRQMTRWRGVRAVKSQASKALIAASRKSVVKVPARLGLKIASSDFANRGGMAGVARCFQVSRHTVRDQTKASTMLLLSMQSLVIDSIIKDLSGPDRPRLLYAMCNLMHDGSSHRMQSSMDVTLPPRRKRPAIADAGPVAAIADAARIDAASVEPRLPRKKKRRFTNTLEIQVAKMRFQWLSERDPRPVVFEPYIPPLDIPSGSAENLWSVLREHQFLKDILRLKSNLLSMACSSGGLAMDLDQTDAAAGVDRFFAATTMVDPPEWSKSHILCMNHQVQIVILSVFAGSIALKFIGTLWTICSFLKMGTYMLRMVMAFDNFLEQPEIFLYELGEPSAEENAYAAELQDCNEKKRQ